MEGNEDSAKAWICSEDQQPQRASGIAMKEEKDG